MVEREREREREERGKKRNIKKFVPFCKKEKIKKNVQTKKGS